MSILVAAVEQGSLSAAARKLGTPLATVSRKVSNLEAHLKTRLLVRSNRQLVLTDAGQTYFATCKRILEEIGEAEKTASGEYSAPRGDLVVSAPIVFGRLHLLPIIVKFLEAYPDVNVRLVLGDRVVNLVEEHIDVALRISVLPDSSLFANRVGTIRRVVCASPSYFANKGTPTHPNELSNHACVTFEGQSSPTSWTFGTPKAPIVVPIRSRFLTTTAEASIDASRLGVGVTRVLSYQVAEAVRAGEMKIVLQEYEPTPIPVSLVHAGGGLIALKLRAFLDYVAPRLKERLVNQPAMLE
jgi:DNA-binding transcriptional LysR family regulator